MLGSSSPFPLLSLPPNMLQETIRKMNPTSLSLTREIVPSVNTLAVVEALENRTQAPHLEIIFDQDKVKILNSQEAEEWAPCSLVNHSGNENCFCQVEAESFWTDHFSSLSPLTAMKHLEGMTIGFVSVLAGTRAEDVIPILTGRNIWFNNLILTGVDTATAETLIDFFEPKKLQVNNCISEQVSEVIADRLHNEILKEVRVSTDFKSPVNLMPIANRFIENFKNNKRGVPLLNISCDGNLIKDPSLEALFLGLQETIILENHIGFTKLYHTADSHYVYQTGKSIIGLSNATFDELRNIFEDGVN